MGVGGKIAGGGGFCLAGGAALLGIVVIRLR